MKTPFLRSFLYALAVLATSFAYSADLGFQGCVFPIEEMDLLEHIENTIKSFPECPDVEFKESFKHPKPVGIGAALVNDVHFYDPTVTIREDIEDNEGNVIVKKGTSVNPLSKYSLDQDLLFFDATKTEQITWARGQGQKTKWILVDGHPSELEEQEQRPIYFDQFGVLIQKLRIKGVPAKVSQQGLKLKIEEFFLEEYHED